VIAGPGRSVNGDCIGGYEGRVRQHDRRETRAGSRGLAEMIGVNVQRAGCIVLLKVVLDLVGKGDRLDGEERRGEKPSRQLYLDVVSSHKRKDIARHRCFQAQRGSTCVHGCGNLPLL
jgi:hypothetical protein